MPRRMLNGEMVTSSLLLPLVLVELVASSLLLPMEGEVGQHTRGVEEENPQENCLGRKGIRPKEKKK